LKEIRQRLGGNAIFDGRNLYEPSRVAAAGFHYHSVGRPAVAPQQLMAAVCQ